MRSYVIADADVLSSFAEAERTERCQSTPVHLPKLYGEPIIVTAEVRAELTNPKGKNEPAKELGRNLPEGFVERNPKVVDPALSERFDVKNDKELGDVHCIALAEQLSKDGSSVLILSSEGAIRRTVKERVAEHGFNIKVASTPDILADSAQHGLITNLKQEATLFHDNGLYRFSAANRQKMEEFHNFVQEQRYQQRHENQQQQDHGIER